MPSKYGRELSAFYWSKAWKRVSAAYMSSKSYICERCGAPAQICHHRKWLNGVNVHDPTVALSFDNLEALCVSCHNIEHGLQHNVTIFDEAGNVEAVKESAGTKEFEIQRARIDDLVADAQRLLCGFK